jgi:hypothetical protein
MHISDQDQKRSQLEKLFQSLIEQCVRHFFERWSSASRPTTYSLHTKHIQFYSLSTTNTTTTTVAVVTDMGSGGGGNGGGGIHSEKAFHVTLFLQKFTTDSASFLAELYLLGKGGARRKTATAWFDITPPPTPSSHSMSEGKSRWSDITLEKFKSLIPSLSLSLSNNNHL